MGRAYDNKMLAIFRQMIKDRNDNKITDEQFDTLFGMLMEKQFSENIKFVIENIIPSEEQNTNQLSWISYSHKESVNA